MVFENGKLKIGKDLFLANAVTDSSKIVKNMMKLNDFLINVSSQEKVIDKS